MRRRPLLRAAAVGGSAYYAGKRRQASQEREMEQEARLQNLEMQPAPPAPQPAAAAPAPGISPDTIQQLQQLGQLRDDGVLTDEEFAQQKAKLLGT
jgi:hypothetical protein